MAEYVRSVTVRVEVDTNKQTYVLNIENPALGEVQRRVEEFIGEFTTMAVGP